MFYVRWSAANYVPGHCPKGMAWCIFGSAPAYVVRLGSFQMGMGTPYPGIIFTYKREAPVTCVCVCVTLLIKKRHL